MAITTALDSLHFYRNSLYQLVSGADWASAAVNARRIGGELVKIDTNEENQFLASTYSDLISELSTDPYVSPKLWLGLERNSEARWLWRDNSGLEYQNWYDDPVSGQEANNLGGIEHVGEMYMTGAIGFWNDAHPILPSNITQFGLAEIPFIRRGGSAYVVVEGPTWEQAEANAQAIGGHLVTINDIDENIWITQNLNYTGKWIGINDKASGGDYIWASGESVEFTNWAHGQPDNNSQMQHYGWFAGSTPGYWDDLQNDPNVSSGIAEIHLFDLEVTYSFADLLGNTLTQQAILGDSVDLSARYNLEITAESLREGYDIESADVTISFDSSLFNDISASDIRIGGELPIANSVHIDNDAGAIRIAAASLSSLASGNGIT